MAGAKGLIISKAQVLHLLRNGKIHNFLWMTFLVFLQHPPKQTRFPKRVIFMMLTFVMIIFLAYFTIWIFLFPHRKHFLVSRVTIIYIHLWTFGWFKYCLKSLSLSWNFIAFFYFIQWKVLNIWEVFAFS